jgi:hypothetical protein
MYGDIMFVDEDDVVVILKLFFYVQRNICQVPPRPCSGSVGLHEG